MTTNTTHTPGPWKTRDSLHENHGIVRTGTHMEVQIHDSVCAEADARLIAAAPELLAALQVLVNDPHDTEPDCWANAARAVAKATGGEA